MADKNEKRKVYLLIGVLIIFCIYLCYINLTDNVETDIYGASSVTLTEEALDTVITIKLYSADNKLNNNELNSIGNKLFDEINRLEKIFSATDEESELAKLNRMDKYTPHTVSAELMEVFVLADMYSRSTNGAFDYTLGELIDLWNITNGSHLVPQNTQIQQFANKKNYENILIDKDSQTITYNGNFNVNFGGIAKGYIGDKIKEMAEKEGISGAMLNLGGNVIALGHKNQNDFWKVAITNPSDASQYYAVVSVKDKCVVTSGNYERFFIKDGVRYHHILDPYTGYPANKNIAGVTIIGDNSAICDALSTGCFVLGKDEAIRLINSLDGYECIIIDEDGNHYLSENVMDYKLELK